MRKKLRRKKAHLDPEWAQLFLIFKDLKIDDEKKLILILFAIKEMATQHLRKPAKYYRKAIHKLHFLGYMNGIPTRISHLPYGYGPYSPRLQKELDFLVKKRLLSCDESYNPFTGETSYRYYLPERVRAYLIDTISKSMIEDSILKKLVNTTAILDRPLQEIEKAATDKMQQYLDTPRPIVYLDKDYENKVLEDTNPKFKASLSDKDHLLTLTEIENKREALSDEMVFQILVRYRKNMPHKELAKERTGDKFSWKYIKRTLGGHSYLYSLIYEVNRVWKRSDQFTRNDLLNSERIVKSIGRLVKSIRPIKRQLNGWIFTEFRFTDDFRSEDSNNYIPVLVDEKRLRCIRESLFEKNLEVFWKIGSKVASGRIEMIPLVILAY